jgi:uncharacterized protein YrzB (UPF0473 family)
MSEEFGPDFISVTDEDGNEFELELVDTLEHNGVTYFALFPAVGEDEETGEQVGGKCYQRKAFWFTFDQVEKAVSA